MDVVQRGSDEGGWADTGERQGAWTDSKGHHGALTQRGREQECWTQKYRAVRVLVGTDEYKQQSSHCVHTHAHSQTPNRHAIYWAPVTHVKTVRAYGLHRTGPQSVHVVTRRVSHSALHRDRTAWKLDTPAICRSVDVGLKSNKHNQRTILTGHRIATAMPSFPAVSPAPPNSANRTTPSTCRMAPPSTRAPSSTTPSPGIRSTLSTANRSPYLVSQLSGKVSQMSRHSLPVVSTILPHDRRRIKTGRVATCEAVQIVDKNISLLSAKEGRGRGSSGWTSETLLASQPLAITASPRPVSMFRSSKHRRPVTITNERGLDTADTDTNEGEGQGKRPVVLQEHTIKVPPASSKPSISHQPPGSNKKNFSSYQPLNDDIDLQNQKQNHKCYEFALTCSKIPLAPETTKTQQTGKIKEVTFIEPDTNVKVKEVTFTDIDRNIKVKEVTEVDSVTDMKSKKVRKKEPTANIYAKERNQGMRGTPMIISVTDNNPIIKGTSRGMADRMTSDDHVEDEGMPDMVDENYDMESIVVNPATPGLCRIQGDGLFDGPYYSDLGSESSIYTKWAGPLYSPQEMEVKMRTVESPYNTPLSGSGLDGYTGQIPLGRETLLEFTNVGSRYSRAESVSIITDNTIENNFRHNSESSSDNNHNPRDSGDLVVHTEYPGDLMSEQEQAGTVPAAYDHAGQSKYNQAYGPRDDISVYSSSVMSETDHGDLPLRGRKSMTFTIGQSTKSTSSSMVSVGTSSFGHISDTQSTLTSSPELTRTNVMFSQDEYVNFQHRKFPRSVGKSEDRAYTNMEKRQFIKVTVGPEMKHTNTTMINCEDELKLSSESTLNEDDYSDNGAIVDKSTNDFGADGTNKDGSTTDDDVDDTIKDECTSDCGTNDTIKDENTSGYGIDSTNKDESTSVYGIDDTIKDENTSGYGIDSTIKDESTNVYGIDDTIKDKGTNNYGIDSTIKDESTSVYGIDDTIKDENTSGYDIDSTIKDERNSDYDIDGTIKDERNSGYDIDSTIKDESTSIYGIDDTIKDASGANHVLDGTTTYNDTTSYGVDRTINDEIIDNDDYDGVNNTTNTGTSDYGVNDLTNGMGSTEYDSNHITKSMYITDYGSNDTTSEVTTDYHGNDTTSKGIIDYHGNNATSKGNTDYSGNDRTSKGVIDYHDNDKTSKGTTDPSVIDVTNYNNTTSYGIDVTTNIEMDKAKIKDSVLSITDPELNIYN